MKSQMRCMLGVILSFFFLICVPAFSSEAQTSLSAEETVVLKNIVN